MEVAAAISLVMALMAFLAILGFLVTLIVGLIIKKQGTKKTGKLGLWISIPIFLIIFISAIIFIHFSPTTDETTDSNQNTTDVSNQSYDASSESSVDYDVNDSSSESDSSDPDEESIGSTVEVNDGSSITVNSITDTSDSLDAPKTGYHAVEASITIENTSSSPIDINKQKFSLYDENDEAGIFDDNTYLKDNAETLAAGKKATIKILFSSKGKTPYSLAYGSITWSE